MSAATTMFLVHMEQTWMWCLFFFSNTQRRKCSHGHNSYKTPNILIWIISDSFLSYVNTQLGLPDIKVKHKTLFWIGYLKKPKLRRHPDFSDTVWIWPKTCSIMLSISHDSLCFLCKYTYDQAIRIRLSWFCLSFLKCSCFSYYFIDSVFHSP